MLHHVPRKSGRTGGGVGVLINDRVKLITRLDQSAMQCHLRVWRFLQLYLYLYD